MSDHSRSLPGKPSLRHLKIEAKRRLAAGEFSLGPRLGERLDLVEDTATHALIQLRAGQLQAVADPAEPHRLVALRAYGHDRVSDSRLAAPAIDTSGDVPAAAVSVAERAFSELGLAGLALAGGDASGAVWALARGWASLDPARPLTGRHRFPAASVTKLVTAIAVLRLTAGSRISLDAPANPQLATVRLADPAPNRTSPGTPRHPTARSNPSRGRCAPSPPQAACGLPPPTWSGSARPGARFFPANW